MNASETVSLMPTKAQDGFRVVVIGRFDAGSLFAHAINTVKMAQAFARLGCAVTVICRRGPQGRADAEKLAEVYGLDASLSWLQLSRRVVGDKKKADWRFASYALPGILRARPALVYARDYAAPTLTSRLGLPTVAESHAHPDKQTRPFRAMVAATHRPGFRAWVTISHRLAEHYRSIGAVADKLLVLPDAVDLRQFARPSALPPSPYAGPGPHIVYAGHLYDYKGIPTVLGTARRMPEAHFHFVGGWPDDVSRQQAHAEAMGLSNVRFHGLQPQGMLPPFLWHADVLLLPPSRHHASAAWTSPMKLGEYLAARVPVAASDIPALRDWLSDEQAAFFEPDDSISLERAIRRLLVDETRRAAQVEAGWRHAQTLSYECRATCILRHAGLNPECSLHQATA